jgi:hypothetical protein
MKRKITLLVASLAMASAMVFNVSSAKPQSCKGQCNRNYNACMATAGSTSEAAQCKKAYQGCISSCH